LRDTGQRIDAEPGDKEELDETQTDLSDHHECVRRREL
jgi:hypothetical protein